MGTPYKTGRFRVLKDHVISLDGRRDILHAGDLLRVRYYSDIPYVKVGNCWYSWGVEEPGMICNPEHTRWIYPVVFKAVRDGLIAYADHENTVTK